MLKRIILREKSSGDAYIEYLRRKGVRIGENLYLPDVRNICIDETRPWLIEIGDNVTLTRGVTLLTHGYDLSVIMNKTGKLLGSSGKVKIGNNVFIGVNTTILKGVTIGDNVIVGANSLINKNIPDNVVVAGSPAKVIMTLDEYILKREKEYLNEAKECIREFIEAYDRMPTHDDLREFFPIYLDRSESQNADSFFMKNKKVNDLFMQTEPIFNGLNHLIEESLNEK